MRLVILADNLKSSQDLRARIAQLDRDERVIAFLEKQGHSLFVGLSQESEIVIKSLIAIGQEGLLSPCPERLRALLQDLMPMESFYQDIGGIVGYQCALLELLHAQKCTGDRTGWEYERPPGKDVSSLTSAVFDYVLEGIRALKNMAELYPVGGAADRLHLIDSLTGHALPAAKLTFCGKTLLEGLICDVQAREYLYYKLFKEQIAIPIAMMTSYEKDNHRQILSICEQNQWFGRSKDSFRFFCQPAVPLADKSGNWCQLPDGKLLMKPGGHGVIWKMARDSGVFDAWKQLAVKKILVRQINNPIAGCDYGLLAFAGIGCAENKAFGFASCERQVESAEGINILLRRKKDAAFECALTNVEYCDFKKWGIEDKPVQEGTLYSQFPSNTNILFVDIEALERAIAKCPIPGMIVNLKKMPLLEDREVARVESTMQNIADCFIDSTLEPASTFLTYYTRRKTISTTKRAYTGGSFLETPEGCFYDVLSNAYDLLTKKCQFTVPPLSTCEETSCVRPAFIFLYHPVLGPLYDIIAQKLRRGKLSLYSELQLEIAELDCENLELDGCLKIFAEDTMGKRSDQGLIQYGDEAGKCVLKNVRVVNRGIDPEATSCYWKNAIARKELCEIIIRGNGEFIAEDVQLPGSLHIEVASGFRVRAVQENGGLAFVKEKITVPLPRWTYNVRGDRIHLMESSEQNIRCS